jgi:hypothetical protein
LDLSGFFRFLHGWISLLKRLDTTGFSPTIRINWNYLDYTDFFISKFTLSKDSIPPVSSSEIRINWNYLDYTDFFISKFTLSKDWIPLFHPLTLELIGIIWIMLIPLSVNSRFQKIGFPRFFV